MSWENLEAELAEEFAQEHPLVRAEMTQLEELPRGSFGAFLSPQFKSRDAALDRLQKREWFRRQGGAYAYNLLREQLRVPILGTARRARDRVKARYHEGKIMQTQGTTIKVANLRLALVRLPDEEELYVRRGAGPREKPKDERPGSTLHFVVLAKDEETEQLREYDGYVTTGLYEDGRLAEIFIRIGKMGAAEALLEQWAIAFSLALQLGADVDWLCDKFTFSKFAPAGAVSGVVGITQCSSLIDLVARWVKAKYGKQLSAKEEVQP
jgi:hypothetical protein